MWRRWYLIVQIIIHWIIILLQRRFAQERKGRDYSDTIRVEDSSQIKMSECQFNYPGTLNRSYAYSAGAAGAVGLKKLEGVIRAPG
jgi:hypothetical protein